MGDSSRLRHFYHIPALLTQNTPLYNHFEATVTS